MRAIDTQHYWLSARFERAKAGMGIGSSSNKPNNPAYPFDR